MTDDLDIPDFLRREKSKPPSRPGGGLDKPQLTGAALCGTEERWKQYEAAQREQRQRKSRGRVAKMLAVRSDRAAVEAGKRWDVKTGRWV